MHLQSNFYNPMKQKMDVSNVPFYSPYLSDSAMKMTVLASKTPASKIHSDFKSELKSNFNSD